MPEILGFRRYNIEVPTEAHKLMREIAKRRRVFIGIVYGEAITLYLEQPSNYMGENKTLALKKDTPKTTVTELEFDLNKPIKPKKRK